MNEPEDFLTRWSRRKQEAADAIEEAAAASPSGEPKCTAQEEPASAATESGLGPNEQSFDLKSLPPIESITAETDIRVFLAPGVPAELARAALRRAWAADSKIRDFVGLADYAWDYNAVGAMPGFGTLKMTDELRRVAERIVTPAEKGPTETGNLAQGSKFEEKFNEFDAGGSPATKPNHDNIETAENSSAKSVEDSSRHQELTRRTQDYDATQYQPRPLKI